MQRALSALVWLFIALLGAGAYAAIAFKRGESLNSGFIVVAAFCTYAIGYRFYSKWIAAKVLVLDDRRATPCEIHEDGRDFCKTNKWIVFGHHFAAISGPGPLVGPVLAAQFGYLPGTLWILIGVVLGGAVQDFIILAASMRRDGRSLGQMLRDELSKSAGIVGTIAILSIMVILLAVLALVVVNALAESPWGVFTVAATIPIAMFMGGYLRWMRVGKVLEASVIGVVLLLAAVWGGQLVAESATLKPYFKMAAEPLAWSVIVYGFAASVLPVWLLLAPRDYLSTFMKLGTIFALAFGTLLLLPDLKMPALTRFVDGSGPVVPGALFPFCFITIACGAISGFHTLISSGVTPKIISRERHARSVGYGAMCLESLVAIMAMIAACTLDPGVYLGVNMKGTPADVVAKASAYGPEFAVTEAQMTGLAAAVKEDTLIGRTGGAATLALGMAQLFARLPFFGGDWLGIWYHFALMFEALFILTTLDAGTRVGRYMLQDAFGRTWLGDVRNIIAGVIASALIVGLWGWFLIGAVRDPDGGIKALWPIFGIANQLLASVALCLATTILLKTGIQRGRRAFAFVTLLPLAWLLCVTGTAAVQKIWHEKPAIGFLAKAADIAAKDIPKAEAALTAAQTAGGDALKKAQATLRSARAQHANNHLNAIVTGAFLALVITIVSLSAWEWIRLLRGTRKPDLSETEPVIIPAGAAPAPGHALGAIALSALLLKELSGEAAIERERAAQACECAKDPAKARRNVFLSATERQFRSPNRCC
jgi:carbon starvation protein